MDENHTDLSADKPFFEGGWGFLPLRYSLPLLLLIFGVLLIVFETFVFITVDSAEAREGTKGRCQRTGERIARIISRAVERNETSTARRELQLIKSEPGVLRALTVTSDGEVPDSLNSEHPSAALPDHVQTLIKNRFSGAAPVTAVISSPKSESVIGAFLIDPADAQQPLVFLLELDLRGPLNDAVTDAFEKALASAVLLLIACVGLWLMLNRVITRRVNHILLTARAIATEEPRVAPLSGRDELSEIDKALHSTRALIAVQAEGIRSQEQRYRTMVESLPAMVFITRDGIVEYMNATGVTMLGLRGIEDIVGRPAIEFISPRYHEVIRQRAATLHALGGTVPTIEEEIIRADGSPLAVEVVASRFTDARGSAIQVIMHDISERKASDARREALGREISNASEREQRRIGQDLHDDICQRLAAVKMSMQDLEESIAEQAPTLMSEADAIVDRITDAIGITRSLARGLSPVDIEAGGLGVALSGLARNAREVMGIECTLDIPDELPALSSHAATQLYRIAQECINNAAKHGHAQHVQVRVAVQDRTLVLRICNDGRPFNPDPEASSHGMGLHIMRHRAESTGATLEFEQQPPDAVVAVRCSLPLASIFKPQIP